MLSTFVHSFALNRTYKKNQFIYFLRHLPLLGDLIHAKAYRSGLIKVITNIYTVLSEIFDIFFWKFIYTALIALLCNFITNGDINLFQNKYVHIMLFFSIIGGLFNNTISDVKESTYSAIFLLRINAKKYLISNFIYSLIKYLVGMLTANIIILGLGFGMPVYICILIPLYAACAKVIVGMFFIRFNEKNAYKADRLGKYQIKNTIYSGILFLSAIEGIVFFAIPYYVIVIITPVAFVLAIKSYIFLIRFDNYKQIYKIILNEGIGFEKDNNVQEEAVKKSLTKKDKDGNDKIIEAYSEKEGYAYFNDIFVQRHKKILLKPVIIASLISFAIYIFLCILMVQTPETFKGFNKSIENKLGIFLFVMYFANRGEAMTQALFYNCDKAMLSFRFYRKPKALIELFVLRLKTILKYNLILSLVLSSGLLVVYYLSGGSENVMNYFALFVTIMAMGVFFSIHYLFLYYIFQPFSSGSSVKHGVYGFITYITYMVCYIVMEQNIPLYFFSLIMILGTIIYFTIAVVIVYLKGTKTFKLRQ